jgi:phospholipase C
MGVEHVVILVLENRPFDEYFGTFPGANGFYSNPESAFANAWVPTPSNWTGPAVLPYRLSTFSSQQSHPPGCGHYAPTVPMARHDGRARSADLIGNLAAQAAGS